MNIISIIEKKRDNHRLSESEINYFIEGYVNNSIHDYQASALLMAICINGMDDEETFYLTKAMIQSGNCVDLSGIDGIKVDKHSTGGVGDKTSLTLGAMLAACGLKVAKMSGRGLSFTGGTLDKLESIDHFNVFLNEEQFIQQVNAIGLAIIGQSDNLVVADKKLYALRDVCGCVPSIPLIASSIMSKKIAAGADIILLDVKYGDGAFMSNKEEAVVLAEKMIAIGEAFQKKVRAEITSMDQVLGNAIGNSLEVIEAVQTLQNNGPTDFKELCIESCATLLCMANQFDKKEDARFKASTVLEDGSAYKKFVEMCKWQDGNIEQIKDLSKMKKSKYVYECTSDTNGYVIQMKTKQLGLIACELGAGRKSKEDSIQHEVGLVLNKKCEDAVCENEVLCYVYANEMVSESLLDEIAQCFVIGENKQPCSPLIYKTI